MHVAAIRGLLNCLLSASRSQGKRKVRRVVGVGGCSPAPDAENRQPSNRAPPPPHSPKPRLVASPPLAAAAAAAAACAGVVDAADFPLPASAQGGAPLLSTHEVVLVVDANEKISNAQAPPSPHLARHLA